MQPPSLESSTNLHDALLSSLPLPTVISDMTSNSTTLLYSIATAAANAIQTSTSPTSTAAVSNTKPDEENNGECKLLGSFAIFVQGALGALALLTLVYKRWKERPQRPLKVWAFDASKQVVGSVLLHLANVVMAMFSAGQISDSLAKTAASVAGVSTEDKYQPNPCSWYLLNLAIDTTLGIPILIVILKVLTVGASYTPLARPKESIESGNYSTPPKATWWMKQCLIYFLGLMGMKSCVFVIFQLCPWLGRVGDWALGWTEGNEAVQIAFVMFIFPLIMNGMQYYIIDIFIKRKDTSEDAGSSEDHGGQDQDEQGRLLTEEPERGTSIDDDEVRKDGLSTETQKIPAQKLSAYAADNDVTVPPDSGSWEGESSHSHSLTSHAEEEGVEHRPRV
ncbi:hypothetical protein PV10_04410 [Exophiala mesophila]|uniref:Vacuolar membrane protein n=1 Tax=Exophiala mesophila TaxID=212818 RepID=A0A0D2A280_EXOME|nr:uncharacterized protein PV10_04410 [Exophiala mesophila]KIV93173.1 hypothetical protein PV10_04410 [Exophiala mesophila]